MDLSGILSIAGYPGLFRQISQMKRGLLVESLLDGRRMPAYATQRILALEEISIYTDDDDAPLSDIFDTIAKKTDCGPALDPKKASIDELRAYLESVLPNYDRDRVYNSDIKKLFLWYNALAEKGLLKTEKGEKEKGGKAKGEKEKEKGGKGTASETTEEQAPLSEEKAAEESKESDVGK